MNTPVMVANQSGTELLATNRATKDILHIVSIGYVLKCVCVCSELNGVEEKLTNIDC
jgi:hypothetical protein